MITNIRDSDEPSFLRHWAERVWDQVQLAQINALQEHLLLYAASSWRPTGQIEPPLDVLLMCACEEGLVLMVQHQPGVWRTSQGTPHKPPRAWMPAPVPPQL